MNDKQKAESYRRDLEKRSLQVVQLNKRIRDLESGLSRLVDWPDGGNLSGVNNMKTFARKLLEKSHG